MDSRLIKFARWSRRYIRLSFLLMVGILTYIMFFGDNSIIDYYRYQQEADRLRAQIIECNDSITYYENLNRLLRTDPETMERIVREQYHMQRQNEDIYIVEWNNRQTTRTPPPHARGRNGSQSPGCCSSLQPQPCPCSDFRAMCSDTCMPPAPCRYSSDGSSTPARATTCVCAGCTA